jgi:hypothetical protein
VTSRVSLNKIYACIPRISVEYQQDMPSLRSGAYIQVSATDTSEPLQQTNYLNIERDHSTTLTETTEILFLFPNQSIAEVSTYWEYHEDLQPTTTPMNIQNGTRKLLLLKYQVASRKDTRSCNKVRGAKARAKTIANLSTAA